MDGPTMNGRVVDGDAALGHHLFEIPQAQTIGQVPPNAEQDDRLIKMPALEHTTLRFCTKRAVAETLKQMVYDGALGRPSLACLLRPPLSQ